jgi:hypothetical protein
MRLVSWNCHDGFDRKTDALLSMVPDIAVLSEVKRRHIESMNAVPSFAFAGPDDKKGVAVLGFNGWLIERVAPIEQKWFLPVVASRGSVRVNVLAIWVIPTTSYVEPTLSELDRLVQFLSSNFVIAAGDFNQNVIFDKGRGVRRRFSTALHKLSQLELASVWHHAKKEEHGRESCSSLYFVYDESRGFHIDYVFASKAILSVLSDVSLGSYADWVKPRISDHVPLTVSLALP